MRILKSKGAFLLVLMFVALGVSACDSFSMFSNTSLSVDEEGELLLGICESSLVDRMFVSWLDSSQEQWHRTLEAEGQPVAVKRGEVYLLGDQPFGFNTQLMKHARVLPGDVIDIGANGVGEESSLFGWFEIPEDGLQPNVWLFSDGSTSNEVCGAYDR